MGLLFIFVSSTYITFLAKGALRDVLKEDTDILLDPDHTVSDASEESLNGHAREHSHDMEDMVDQVRRDKVLMVRLIAGAVAVACILLLCINLIQF